MEDSENKKINREKEIYKWLKRNMDRGDYLEDEDRVEIKEIVNYYINRDIDQMLKEIYNFDLHDAKTLNKLWVLIKTGHFEGKEEYEWMKCDFNKKKPWKTYQTLQYITGHTWIVKQLKDGKLHGTFVEFHKNGVTRAYRHYHEGKLHGTSEYWYESGIPEEYAEYRHGKYHGEVKLWRDNGQLFSHKFYKDGQPDDEKS